MSLRYSLGRMDSGGALPQEPEPGLASVPADLEYFLEGASSGDDTEGIRELVRRLKGS